MKAVFSGGPKLLLLFAWKSSPLKSCVWFSSFSCRGGSLLVSAVHKKPVHPINNAP